MSSSKTGKRLQQFGERPELPFRDKKPGSSSGSTDQGIASSIGGAAHATMDNPQLLPISVPVKNEAFQTAIQEYIDKLPDDDKVAFHSATDVMEKLAELQSHISSPHTRMQRVQKVLQCVKQFLGSIAIYIEHHPKISTLVVGGLHCVLTVHTPFNFNILF